MDSILATEVSEPTIQELRAKKLPKVEAMVANLFEPRPWARLKQIMPSPTTPVLDPPREGFEAIDEHLDRTTSLKNIFYISCNVETFARDCGKLLALGFKVAKIQPVDMFPSPPRRSLRSSLSLSVPQHQLSGILAFICLHSRTKPNSRRFSQSFTPHLTKPLAKPKPAYYLISPTTGMWVILPFG